MDATTLAVISGTGVPPFVCRWVYRHLSKLANISLVESLPSFGRQHPEKSYEELAPKLDRSDGPLVILGHSQGGLVGLTYAARNPQKVACYVGISVPHHGTTRCWTNAPTASLRSMAPESRFIHHLGEELVQLRQGDISPELYSIFSIHDGLVVPYMASYLEGAANFLFAPRERHPALQVQLPPDVMLVDSGHQPSDHFRFIFNSQLASLLGDIVTLLKVNAA